MEDYDDDDDNGDHFFENVNDVLCDTLNNDDDNVVDGIYNGSNYELDLT